MITIGSKVKIKGLDVIGIITGFDVTMKYAHVSYVFNDDEEKVINYGCFNIKSKVRVC